MKNIPLFIAFRVLFNARWYYPIMAVLFLDLGVTLVEFALLNVAWAISIVCLEVPSGALADQVGRKRMVVLAAVLMVAEMLLLAFVPAESVWLFPVLILNRILSGAAEASASGADESLAFDSLVEVGREAEWPSVLARLMRWQSLAFLVAMLVGSAVYDPELVQSVSAFFGLSTVITQATTLRWPVYLTLASAGFALLIAAQMREPLGSRALKKVTAIGTLRQTLAAGRWILSSRTVLLVILAGLCLDSTIRMFFTVNSNYYRLIGLPEASFGPIAAGLAVIGFFTPQWSRSLVVRRSMQRNFALAGVLGLAGLGICAAFWPIWGLIAVLPLGLAFSMMQFFVSHYINAAITDSSLRATVLSFRGLSFNLGYGAVGLIFAAVSRSSANAGDAVFRSAMASLPMLLAAGMLGVFCFSVVNTRRTASP